MKREEIIRLMELAGYGGQTRGSHYCKAKMLIAMTLEWAAEEIGKDVNAVCCGARYAHDLNVMKAEVLKA